MYLPIRIKALLASGLISSKLPYKFRNGLVVSNLVLYSCSSCGLLASREDYRGRIFDFSGRRMLADVAYHCPKCSSITHLQFVIDSNKAYRINVCTIPLSFHADLIQIAFRVIRSAYKLPTRTISLYFRRAI